MDGAYTAAQIRAAEAPHLEAGVDLMSRAARGLASHLMRLTRPGEQISFFVGAGNNGADALYAAALLRSRTVTIYATCPPHPRALAAARDAGAKFTGDLDLAAASPVWVDAITGLGFHPPLRPGLLETLRRLLKLQESQHRLVVAVDLPSGVNPDSGKVDGPVLQATHTVTFGAYKPVQFLPPASDYCGQVHLVDIGLRPDFAAHKPALRRLRSGDVARAWPVPGRTDHKYIRGVVGLITGSQEFPGAGVLTAGGALGVGPGMVRYLGQEPAPVLSAYPEVVSQEGKVQALVVGSGMLPEHISHNAVISSEITKALTDRIPIILDAGALGWLGTAQGKELRLTSQVLLTPHAGELTQLLNAHGCEVTREQVEADPERWVRQGQKLTGASVLLKGFTTLIAYRDQLWSQSDGTPWMASAGTGDVLAGVLGGVLSGWQARIERDGQAEELGQAIAAAVAVHGYAGKEASNGGPTRARLIADHLPVVVGRLLKVEGRD